jgi:multidrug efflux pump subunit AcrA (membrane-fusion protein)
MAKANRIWVILIVALIAGAGLVLSLGLLTEHIQEQAAAPEPLIVSIGYGNIENAIPAPGTLAPGEVVSVLANATGEIAEFHVAPGDRVVEGQLLATIDPDVGPGLSEVRAPIAGNVIEIQQRVGTWFNVSQSAPSLMLIADLENLSVMAEVFDNEVARVDDAIGVYFTMLGSGDRRWYGNGIRVRPTPTMDDGIARYAVQFNVDNEAGELYPGMTTQVYFVTSAAESVLRVPLGALTLGDANGDTRNATVEVVHPNGGTSRRDVVVRAMDRVHAEVVSGLVEGDRVVAGTILPEVELSDEPGARGQGRPRGDERFFERAPDEI